MDDYLEDEYKPAYAAWKLDQSPQGNATFLKAIDPVVQKGLKMYGDQSPLASSQARLTALEAARKYDPSRSRLQSHMLNHMQGLRRATRQQSEIMRVPERVYLERQKLRGYTQELSDELGREPSDAELADKLGVSMARIAKIRQFRTESLSSGMEGNAQYPTALSSQLPQQREAEEMWRAVVYQDLQPIDQKIMEMTLGMNGHEPRSNAEIARALNRSPGAITQRKAKIQQLLDKEERLSPFLGS